MKKNYTLVAACLGLAQLVSAQDRTKEDPSRTVGLNEVVVTASRSPRKQSEIGKVVRVIDAAQLARSQGRTLVDVLNNVAGVTLSGTGNAPGQNVTVFTRGASRGNTLILIDGIPANNASDINNDYDISSISIDQIARIEILRGANSTLYGSDAVAGVINIITKQPSSDKFKGEVVLTGGSYKSSRQAFGINGTQGKTGFSLNFSNTSSKGFSVAQDKANTKTFDHDEFKQQSLSTHLKQQLSKKLSVGANLQFNSNAFGLDDGSFVDDKDYTGKNITVFGGLNAKYNLAKGTITAIVNQNNATNTFYDPDGATNFSKQRNEGRVTYTEVVINHPVTSFADITAGANYRHAETDQAYNSMSAFGPYDSALSSKDANNSIKSAFASFFFKFSGINLELGGRYNDHSIYGDNYTYTINPSYVFHERFKVFVNLASAFKAPSLYHLTSQYKNPDGLDPETTRSKEAGFDLDIIEDKLNFSATGFIRKTSNIIYFYTNPSTFASQYRNGYKQNDRGFEAELAAVPVKNVHVNAWYAYVKGKSTDISGANTDFLLRRPKNSYGGNAAYDINKVVSVNLIYKYTGNRFDPVGYPVVNTPQHSYHLIDTYVQVKPYKGITLFADVKNVFDRPYVEWTGYNTKGRNFNAGLKYEIN